jgi:hypothetical protein
MSQRLFISHSTRDKRYADPLHTFLTRLGFRVWTDPAPRPGLDWRFEIDDAIRTSDGGVGRSHPPTALRAST